MVFGHYTMQAIQDSRVSLFDGKWRASCVCGRENAYANKSSALKMLRRGSCRHCKKDYRNVEGDVPIYKNADNKWCSTCSGCGLEQAYTRKDHAKQSELADWQCKSCVAKSKGFSRNMPVGDGRRLYNKFRKSANNRRILWALNYDQFMACYTGYCELSEQELSMKIGNTTASLDRIDSSRGYEPENVQWVSCEVNMMKRNLPQEKFLAICNAVSRTAEKKK